MSIIPILISQYQHDALIMMMHMMMYIIIQFNSIQFKIVYLDCNRQE